MLSQQAAASGNFPGARKLNQFGSYDPLIGRSSDEVSDILPAKRAGGNASSSARKNKLLRKKLDTNQAQLLAAKMAGKSDAKPSSLLNLTKVRTASQSKSQQHRSTKNPHRLISEHRLDNQENAVDPGFKISNQKKPKTADANHKIGEDLLRAQARASQADQPIPDEDEVLAPAYRLQESADKKATIKSSQQIFEANVQSPQDSKPAKTKRKGSWLSRAYYGFGAAVFVLALGVSIQTLLLNRSAQEVLGETTSSAGDNSESSVVNGSNPSEAQPSQNDISSYQVPPEKPRYIRISSLNVFARVAETGVTSENAVDAPHNIYDSSWYNASALPGSSAGTSLILGHVSGWTAPGVFKNLKNIEKGAVIKIEKGNGEELEYRVASVEEIDVDKVDMNEVLRPSGNLKRDLKIMTCGGEFDSETREFQTRIIVSAKQI